MPSDIVDVAEHCFGRGRSPEYCCDTGVSPVGRMACWDRTRHFRLCCTGQSGVIGRPSDSLYHSPGASQCWPEQTRVLVSICCDLRYGPTGNEECWNQANGPSYEHCCSLRQRDPSPSALPCEASFRDCLVCRELLFSPRIGRTEWQQCNARGGGMTVLAPAGLSRTLAFCTPIDSACNWNARVILAGSVQAETYLPSLDLDLCRPAWNAETLFGLVGCLAPFFVLHLCRLLGRISLAGRHRSEHATAATQGSRGTRDPIIDLMRVVATAATYVIHENIRPFYDGGSGWVRFVEVAYVQRFTDLYFVCAVVLQSRRSWTPGGCLEALFAKLGRQLPILFFPRHVIGMLNGYLCPRATTCREPDSMLRGGSWWRFAWSTILMRWDQGAFAYGWAFQMDLRIFLTLNAVLALQHVWPSATSGVVAGLLAWGMAEAQKAPHGPHYFGFLTYRLPMALIVFLVVRRPWPLRWRRPRWTCATSVLLLALGWAGCGPLSPGETDASGQMNCMEHGWGFLLRGLAFQLGAAGLCLLPAPRLPPLGALSDLSLGVLRLHGHVLAATKRCERAQQPPWSFAEDAQYVAFFSDHYIDRPLWVSVCWWIGALCACLLVSQFLLWSVQRPWAALLSRVPSRFKRFLALLYIFVLLCDACHRGYADLILPIGDPDG